jgi:hypothetical protein
MRILLADANPGALLDLCDRLEGKGHEVLGPVTTRDKALELAETVDAAFVGILLLRAGTRPMDW